uniref:NT5C2 protein n=1 Tax=Mesocestoides corti TaxID=53468 RepID=A0A5K3F2Y6_MESCO
GDFRKSGAQFIDFVGIDIPALTTDFSVFSSLCRKEHFHLLPCCLAQQNEFPIVRNDHSLIQVLRGSLLFSETFPAKPQ